MGNCLVKGQMKKILMFLLFSIAMISCHKQGPLKLTDLVFDDDKEVQAAKKNKVATSFSIIPAIEVSRHPEDTISIYWYDSTGNVYKSISRVQNEFIEKNYNYDSIGWLTSKTIDCPEPEEYHYKYLFDNKASKLTVSVSGTHSYNDIYFFNADGKVSKSVTHLPGNLNFCKLKNYSYNSDGEILTCKWVMVRCKNDGSLDTTNKADSSNVITHILCERMYFYNKQALDSTILIQRLDNNDYKYKKDYVYYKDGLIIGGLWDEDVSHKYNDAIKHIYKYSTTKFYGMPTMPR